MTKNRMLILFVSAGLILALVLGTYFYRSNLGPTRDEVTALLTNYTNLIKSGELSEARSLMTEETGQFLREPGTVLGETVYRNLELRSVDHIYAEEGKIYTADVVWTAPDMLKIMTKAGMLFGEQVSESGPAENPDQALDNIYREILSREDLPMLDQFCVVRMEVRNGHLLIIGDTALQQVLEGNPELTGSVLEKFSENSQ